VTVPPQNLPPQNLPPQNLPPQNLPPTPTPGYPPPTYPPPPPGYVVPPGAYAVPPPGYATAPPAYRMVLPPMSPSGQRLAEFGDRALAYIIDALILGLINLIISIPVYVVVLFFVLDPAQLESGDPFDILLPLIGIAFGVLAFSLLITYVYEVEMMFRTGQTIGKRVMKIQIVPIDPARTLTRQMAFKRYLVGHVATTFIPAFTWIDGLWQLWDKPYQQCLHDKFAETVVIKLNP
jgi:uncharacterized RDD family membrane protein YckC